ncbi:MAG: hypothetical protein KIT84_11955 [Labilithrix sp.]|nr:hypothetical protein [Labilithrix sp.]MCW5811725.1 hypothetical protein [Labilithrix sp.]
MTRGVLLLLLLLAGVLASPPALAAPKKDECIAAFDKGQRARREGHFKESTESLLVCSQQECPAVVRVDCAEVLRQVEAAQPTIVLKATDAKGADLTDVSVELNGDLVASSLDGRAIAVDPGKLTLVFKRAPWDPVTVNVMLAEAEKNRIVAVTLGPPAEPPPAMPPVRAIEPEPKRDLVGWIVPGTFAAVGAGALAFAGIVRLGAGSEADDLKARCGPTCPESDRDRLSGELVKANVLLGVGIGGLVLAAATWFILAPRRPQLAMRGLTW